MKVNIDICKMHLKLFYASNEDYVITNTVLQVLKEEKVILSYELFDGEYEIKFLNKEDKNFILANIKDFINKKLKSKGLKTDIDQKDVLKEIAKVKEKGVPKYDNESIYKSFFNSGR